MPPGTRRANRGGYTEHDDFEGLPVRQWRTEWVSIAPPPAQEQQHHNDIWALELPHGMPKDSQLLPSYSQELLRVARSGRLYKRTAINDDDDGDTDGLAAPVSDNVKSEGKKEDESETRGFTVRLWKQVPRNIEASPTSYLAKRRKGTITIASRTVQDRSAGPTVTRATVKRIDAAGNPYTEEVTLAEGQPVDGEIISTRVEVANTSSADVLTPLQVPQKRRPPPPKRKSKAGPGRGRKKMKIPLPADGKSSQAAPAPNYVQAIKIEDQADQGANRDEAQTPNPDSEAADGEDDDDDDDGDDGDEADDGEDCDEQSETKQDEIMTDAVSAAPDLPGDSEEPVFKEATPPQPATLAPPLVTRSGGSPRPEGSPLKNVMLPSPTEPAPTEQHFSTDNSQIAEGTVESMKSEPPSPVPSQEQQESADIETVMVPALSIKEETSEPPPSVDDEMTAQDGTLLPPPPDQVGNIDSPRSESKHSDNEDRREDDPSETGATEPASFTQGDSILTEDTLKPDDSASTRFQLTESGAPSEVGTASGEGTRDFTVATEQPSPTAKSNGSNQDGCEEQADTDEVEASNKEPEEHDG
ncbi:hypothetical protein CDD81_6460 [Ophiocordyceps australis]|uniref:Uncharacterized protein n=1 Tax=Ophiocordyceps australis TaxID=1399860 RepID=A0A2C5YG81_9HYPO|nr:hypothetical protein CDD81_6460 [Ophiocordyceps australis]